jgi:hypothetical protein
MLGIPYWIFILCFYPRLSGPCGLLWVYYCIYPHLSSVIALKHLKQLQVLLLDEITVDLDVVTRMDLLGFFKEECEQVHKF